MESKTNQIRHRLSMIGLGFLVFLILLTSISFYSIKTIRKSYSILKGIDLANIILVVKMDASFKRIFMELQSFLVTNDKSEINEFEKAYSQLDELIKNYHGQNQRKSVLKKDFLYYQYFLRGIANEMVPIYRTKKGLLYELRKIRKYLIDFKKIHGIKVLNGEEEYAFYQVLDYLNDFWATILEDSLAHERHKPVVDSSRMEKAISERVIRMREVLRKLESNKALEARWTNEVHRFIQLASGMDQLIKKTTNISRELEEAEDQIFGAIQEALYEESFEIEMILRTLNQIFLKIAVFTRLLTIVTGVLVFLIFLWVIKSFFIQKTAV